MFCWIPFYVFVTDTPVVTHNGAETSPEWNIKDLPGYFSRITGTDVCEQGPDCFTWQFSDLFGPKETSTYVGNRISPSGRASDGSELCQGSEMAEIGKGNCPFILSLRCQCSNMYKQLPCSHIKPPTLLSYRFMKDKLCFFCFDGQLCNRISRVWVL